MTPHRPKPFSHRLFAHRPPILVRLGALISLMPSLSWAADTAAAANAATSAPPLLVVIGHAGIVYAIAIVISILTAVLIKCMNVVMAARRGNEAESA